MEILGFVGSKKVIENKQEKPLHIDGLRMKTCVKDVELLRI